MKKIIILSFIFLLGAASPAQSRDLLKWFSFDKENALDEWQEKIFSGRVFYKVEAKPGGGYLSAQSKKACSGLLYKISFHPRKFPMLSWQWRVDEFPKKEETPRKDEASGWIERDDYAARVYVIFPSWYFMHTETIEYIWDETMPEGTVITSPYFKRIKLIVTESGKENMGKWVSEERNIYDDYIKAFGKAPKAKVGAIAIMTDTDNTLSTAEAQYKNIKVGYEK